MAVAGEVVTAAFERGIIWAVGARRGEGAQASIISIGLEVVIVCGFLGFK